MARLTKDRVLVEALAFADQHGIDKLTIRALASHIGSKPMSLYHYFANKEAILDGLVDLVYAEIEVPPDGLNWKEALVARAHSMRVGLKAHPWALPLIESRRNPSRQVLLHHEILLSIWFSSGLDTKYIAHGLATLDAFVFGFVLQELSLPLEATDDSTGSLVEASEQVVVPLSPGDFPFLTKFTSDYVMTPEYDFGKTFDFGLNLILDAIEGAATEGR
ncbi:AcrR-like transcription factor [Pontimonas salivibrio]|uniref:AcrR-like transcription factor n=1 Tax=Pontimonas salivibrio TaxID=1159327 RepID=A0A2L2BPU8_9MICO|nr:TetR/AcrR family transcriptional regulator C-terminal domain-containing protein [Pontimonas salivibrio]AVG23700.1 AcrR-like transcription factor [Pontimonas salivibrio]